MLLWPVKTPLWHADMRKLTENLLVFFRYTVCVWEMDCCPCIGLKFEPNFAWSTKLFSAWKMHLKAQTCRHSLLECYSLVFCYWPLNVNVWEGDVLAPWWQYCSYRKGVWGLGILTSCHENMSLGLPHQVSRLIKIHSYTFNTHTINNIQ